MITLTPVSVEAALEGVHIPRHEDEKVWVVIDLERRDDSVAAIIMVLGEDACES